MLNVARAPRGALGGRDYQIKKIANMKMMDMKHTIAWILVMVGGLNWLLVGLGGFMGSDWNLVHAILGGMPALEWLVYVLVGVSAVYEIVMHKKLCKNCASGMSSSGMGAM